MLLRARRPRELHFYNVYDDDAAFVPIIDAALLPRVLQRMRETCTPPLTLFVVHTLLPMPKILLADAHTAYPDLPLVVWDGRVHALYAILLLTQLMDYPTMESLALERILHLLDAFLPRASPSEDQLAAEVDAKLTWLAHERLAKALDPEPWERLLRAVECVKDSINRF